MQRLEHYSALLLHYKANEHYNSVRPDLTLGECLSPLSTGRVLIPTWHWESAYPDLALGE